MNDRIKPDDEQQPHRPDFDEDRYGVDEATGFLYIKKRPGDRMVTSEEILKELEDFP